MATESLAQAWSEIVKELFVRFGHLARHTLGVREDTKENQAEAWYKAFQAEGFTGSDLRRGMRRLLESPPPRNMPSLEDFIGMSQPAPEDAGWMSANEAFGVACRFRTLDSAPAAVVWVVQALGGSAVFSALPAPEARKAFFKCYRAEFYRRLRQRTEMAGAELVRISTPADLVIEPASPQQIRAGRLQSARCRELLRGEDGS